MGGGEQLYMLMRNDLGNFKLGKIILFSMYRMVKLHVIKINILLF